MASYPIPPWLTQADPVATYTHGLQIGTQIGQEQAAQQLRQESIARQQQKDQIEQEIEQAKIHLSADAAARKYAAQQQYQELIDQGVPPDQAFLKVGPAMGAAAGAISEAMHLPVQRQQAESMDQIRQIQAQHQADMLAETVRHHKVQEDHAAGPVGDEEPSKKELFPGIFMVNEPGSKRWQIVDTNKGKKDTITPDLAQKLLNTLSKVDAASGKTTDDPTSLMATKGKDLLDIIQKAIPSAKKTGRVKVKSKDGQTGTIPADQLDKAIEQGFTEVK